MLRGIGETASAGCGPGHMFQMRGPADFGGGCGLLRVKSVLPHNETHFLYKCPIAERTATEACRSLLGKLCMLLLASEAIILMLEDP
jgi:hypothetical protein